MEQVDRKTKRPGSVRLTDAQYKEMERLGFDNESAYVKHKMNDVQNHLKVISHNVADGSNKETSSTTLFNNKSINDALLNNKSIDDALLNNKSINDADPALAIQRLEIENRQLQEKMERLMQVKDQALNGVHQQVGNLLKEELQRRDFDQLKKEHATQSKELDKLELQLKKSETAVEEKEEEVKSLLKKLSFIELGKVLLPGAINGLAKRFPSQMQGLATTLGAITDGSDTQTPATEQGISEEQQNLLQIAEYFRELFDEQQFEQLVQLVMQMGETIKTEPELFQKISYYLSKLQSKGASDKPQ